MELEPGLACHPELLEEQGVAVWKVGCELVRHGACSGYTMLLSNHGKFPPDPDLLPPPLPLRSQLFLTPSRGFFSFLVNFTFGTVTQ